MLISALSQHVNGSFRNKNCRSLGMFRSIAQNLHIPKRPMVKVRASKRKDSADLDRGTLAQELSILK
jgi:hypothetical protein